MEIETDVRKIMRKQPFTSEARICNLCNALLLSSESWINHFRFGDEKHKVEYRKVQRFLIESDGVTDKKVLSYLIDKHLIH